MLNKMSRSTRKVGSFCHQALDLGLREWLRSVPGLWSASAMASFGQGKVGSFW
jgi:hypothetical protein